MVLSFAAGIGAVGYYFYQDHRQDQWLALIRTIDITDGSTLRRQLAKGEISREDLPDALLFCVQNGLTQGVKSLIDAGAEVNVRDARGITVVELARRNGQSEIAQMLVKAGATN
jgi:hypothetical protein